MDRYPGYESMLARVEQKKVQVKGQLPTFYSHLVDNMVAFVLDQVNECCNVATVDATTNTTEDHLLADGPVARALDNPSEVNEQTNPQVDHHIQGSISNEQSASPPSVTHSTIPANIEVKVEDVSDGQSVQLCKRVKKEEDGGEYVMDCDCGECEICRVKREMKEELDESGETEQMEDCVKQEIKEELEDGEMMHIKEEEEEDGEVEGQRPNKIQRMDRVLGNVPLGSLSPSTNGIPINVQYIDDQVATSSTHPITIQDHTQTYQHVTFPFPTPIVTQTQTLLYAQHEPHQDELLNGEPMMVNVALEVDARTEEFDREQVDHDSNSTLNLVHIDQDDDETEVDDNQNDEDEGDETIEQREVPSADDDQQVPVENFVKRIEPDELGNNFECNYQACGKRMKSKQNLLIHIRTHTGEKPFKCTVNGCDRAFAQKAQLRAHLNTHSGTRPFVCSWPRCDARFGSKFNLTAHLRTHTGERPFVCTWPRCDARFGNKCNLNSHTRTHTGERPFECDQCDATFTHQSNLANHLRTHTGVRPFVCTWPNCGLAFTQSSTLKTHSLAHSNERKFVCEARGCTKVYKRKDALRQHQMDKHN